MSNIAKSTMANAFYQARCQASIHNDALGSRDGAAEIMSIDRGRLYKIEKGVANPYPEEVLLMADLYSTPELKNYYCTTTCPLGQDMPKVSVQDLDRITVRALNVFRKIDSAKEILLDVAEDGQISGDEKEDMEKVLQTLDEMEEITQSLKLWVKKNM